MEMKGVSQNGHLMTESLATAWLQAQEKAIMAKYKADEAANKDFEAEVTVAGSKKEYLPQGTYVTNCRVCNHTCHENCAIPNDEDKHRCWAMTDGNCRICQRKCHWSEHSNMPFKFVATQHKEKRKAADIEAKYKEALRERGAAPPREVRGLWGRPPREGRRPPRKGRDMANGHTGEHLRV